MPGFPGRAESEGRKSGHELIWGEGMLEYSGEGWGLGWVGHLGPLQNDRLGRVSCGGGQGMLRSFVSLTLFL